MVNTEIRLNIFFAAKDGEAQYRQQKQDQELTVAQIKNSLLQNSSLKLKKLRKTTKRLRYDVTQIPYDYTEEVTNRFKGLDLIHRVPEELWTQVRDIIQEAVIKQSPRKRNTKRQNSCPRRPYKELRKEE